MRFYSLLRVRGGRLRLEKSMNDVGVALDDCALCDLGFYQDDTLGKGEIFSTNIRERLDRGVASLDWWQLFSNFLLEHIPHALSNHCLVLIDTLGRLKGDNFIK